MVRLVSPPPTVAEIPRRCRRCGTFALYVDHEVWRQSSGELLRVGCVICGADGFYELDGLTLPALHERAAR